MNPGQYPIFSVTLNHQYGFSVSHTHFHHIWCQWGDGDEICLKMTLQYLIYPSRQYERKVSNGSNITRRDGKLMGSCGLVWSGSGDKTMDWRCRTIPGWSSVFWPDYYRGISPLLSPLSSHLLAGPGPPPSRHSAANICLPKLNNERERGSSQSVRDSLSPEDLARIFSPSFSYPEEN